MTSPKQPDRALYNRIKEAFRNVSDTEVAERLQVTKQAVSQWKRGGSPSSALLVRTAELTNTSLEWLLTGNESYRQSGVQSSQPSALSPELRLEIRREIIEVLGMLLLSKRDQAFTESMLDDLSRRVQLKK